MKCLGEARRCFEMKTNLGKRERQRTQASSESCVTRTQAWISTSTRGGEPAGRVERAACPSLALASLGKWHRGAHCCGHEPRPRDVCARL